MAGLISRRCLNSLTKRRKNITKPWRLAGKTFYRLNSASSWAEKVTLVELRDIYKANKQANLNGM